MNEMKLKIEIVNAIEDCDAKISKLEMSLKDFMVAKMKECRKEMTDLEIIELFTSAVGERRSKYTINEWFRDAGIRQRGVRSDKGKETTPDPALEPIRASLRQQLKEGDWSKSAEAKIRKALADLS